MATTPNMRVFYLDATDIIGMTYDSLTPDNAPINVVTNTGFINGIQSTTRFWVYHPNIKIGATSNVGTIEPVSFTSFGFRTPEPLRGRFATGTWSLTWSQTQDATTDASTILGFRIWKSINPNGTGAVQVTAGWTHSGTRTWNVANGTQTGTITTASISAFTLDNHYLFLELDSEVIAISATTTCNQTLNINQGSGAALTTTDFEGDVNYTLDTAQQIVFVEQVLAPIYAVHVPSGGTVVSSNTTSLQEMIYNSVPSDILNTIIPFITRPKQWVFTPSGGMICSSDTTALQETVYSNVPADIQNTVIPFVLGPKQYNSPSLDTKASIVAGTAAPTTANYTCGASALLLTLSVVTSGLTARAGGLPTYNGVAFVQASTTTSLASTGETTVELFYMLSPPTGSSLSVSIPNTGSAKTITCELASFNDNGPATTYILQAANNATGTAINPAGPTLTGLQVRDVVVSVIGSGANTWAPTPQSGTILYNVDDGLYGDGSQYKVITSGTTDQETWTFGTSEDYAIVSAAFRAVVVETTSGGLIISSNTAQQQEISGYGVPYDTQIVISWFAVSHPTLVMVGSGGVVVGGTTTDAITVTTSGGVVVSDNNIQEVICNSIPSDVQNTIIPFLLRPKQYVHTTSGGLVLSDSNIQESICYLTSEIDNYLLLFTTLRPKQWVHTVSGGLIVCNSTLQEIQAYTTSDVDQHLMLFAVLRPKQYVHIPSGGLIVGDTSTTIEEITGYITSEVDQYLLLFTTLRPKQYVYLSTGGMILGDTATSIEEAQGYTTSEIDNYLLLFTTLRPRQYVHIPTQGSVFGSNTAALKETISYLSSDVDQHLLLFTILSSSSIVFTPSGGIVVGGTNTLSITETPSGGTVISGSTVPIQGYTNTVVDSVLLAFSVDAHRAYVNIPSSGTVVGGTNTLTLIPTVSGGTVVGGVNSTSVIHTPSGGSVLSGSTVTMQEYITTVVDGILLTFITDLHRFYNETVSGGVVVGGVAPFEWNDGKTFTFTPSGGVIVSGSAATEINLFHIPSGGVIVGNNTNVSVFVTPDGGTVAGGTNSISIGTLTSGGTVVSGNSSLLIESIPNGGLVVGGITHLILISNVDGGTVVGGDANVTEDLIFTPSGGLVVGATNTLSIEVLTQGGTVVGGNYTVYYLETTEGGICISGEALDTISFVMTSSGGIVSNGYGNFLINLILSVSGGVILGGRYFVATEYIEVFYALRSAKIKFKIEE